MNKPGLFNPHLDGEAFFWKTGPVGVFLSHGFTATTAEIRYLAGKFNANGYTVAAPLLPGHGTQPEDLNSTHWQDWAYAGEEMLTKLFETCEQVFVGGQSLGGVLALYLASQEPRVAGVLLYAPAIRTPMSTLDLVKLYVGSPFITQVERESPDCSTEWQGYPGLPLKGAIQLLQFQNATIKRLSNIKHPVIIFQGRHDTIIAPESGKIILESVSSTVKEHHWMEKSNHAIVLDSEREQVVMLSIRFIGSCIANQN